MRRTEEHIIRDLLILTVSIWLAFFLHNHGIVEKLIGFSEKSAILGSFIGGMMFTSFVTTAPGIVVLVNAGHVISPFLVAGIGVFGAVLSDLILFRIIRDYIAEDIAHILKHGRLHRFLLVLRNPHLRLSLGIIAAVLIISPLPDELAITVMGLGHIKTKHFVPIAMCLHFIGILSVGLIGTAIR